MGDGSAYTRAMARTDMDDMLSKLAHVAMLSAETGKQKKDTTLIGLSDAIWSVIQAGARLPPDFGKFASPKRKYSITRFGESFVEYLIVRPYPTPTRTRPRAEPGMWDFALVVRSTVAHAHHDLLDLQRDYASHIPKIGALDLATTLAHAKSRRLGATEADARALARLLLMRAGLPERDATNAIVGARNLRKTRAKRTT